MTLLVPPAMKLAQMIRPGDSPEEDGPNRLHAREDQLSAESDGMLRLSNRLAPAKNGALRLQIFVPSLRIPPANARRADSPAVSD